MTVGELIDRLKKFDASSIVITDKWSDYITIGDVRTMEVFPNTDGWYQHVYGSLTGDPRIIKATYLESK